MRTPPQASGHFTALDALRGVAACGVALAHVPWTYTLSDVAGRNGHLFVDFFFVLSGFVIAFNYGGKIAGGAARFVWLRFWRLYPLHFAMLMVFVVIEAMKWYAAQRYGLAANHPAFVQSSPRAFAANLLLLQAVADTKAFNSVSWSISTEFAAYLVFAAVGLAAGRRWLLASAGVLIVAAIFVALDQGGMNRTVGALAFNRCLFGFFLGVMTFWAASRTDVFSRLGPRAAALVCAVPILTLAALLIFNTARQTEFLAPLLSTAVIFALVASPPNAVAAALSTPAMAWLGRISYSIYMVHLAVFWAISQVLRVVLHLPEVSLGGAEKIYLVVPQPFADLLAAAALAAIMLLAHGTYGWIEAPWRNWSRSHGLGLRPAP